MPFFRRWKSVYERGHQPGKGCRRKHHYIPAFYLKRWAGDDEQVSSPIHRGSEQ